MLKLILILSLTAFGCSNETASRQSHEPAVVAGLETSSGAPNVTLGSAIGAATTAPPSAQDAAIFARKFKVQLSKDRLDQQLRESDPRQREELYNSVETASLIASTLKAGPERQMILETFSAAVQSGCSEKLAGCRYLSLFRRQAGSVTLALAASDETKTSTDRIRALSMAFALVGDVDDTRIAVAYLRSTPLIESTLSETSNQSLKIRHQEIVEHSLIQLAKSLRATKAENRSLEVSYQELLANLSQSWDIFNFARARSPEKATRENTLFSLVATKALESDELSRQSQQTQKLENSISKKISRTAGPAKKAFGIAEPVADEFHLFLFDSLWLGRLTTVEADLLWAAHVAQMGESGQSDSLMTELRTKAQDALLNYFKSRLLATSKDVNSIVVDFFNEKNKFITANAFQDGLKETLKGATIWADARRRFETLQAFNERNLRSTNFEIRTTKDLERFMASLDRNIKVLSTYPSMLVMAYNLARLDFSLKVFTWTGLFEIKAGLILDWFFSGTLSPWMAYSNDPSPLSKSEISQVFFYALEMGVLTESGVSLDELFRMLTEQMVGPLRADVQKIDDSFRSAFDENPMAVDFQRLCQLQQASGRAADAAPVISLKDLTNYTISGTPQYGLSGFLHPTFNAAWALFEIEQAGTRNRLDDNLEIVRLEFTPRISHLRSLHRMVNDYVTRHSVPGGAATSESINRRLVELETLRRKVYSRVFRLVKTTGPCGDSAIDHELSSQVHAIEGLIAHFKQVHVEMKALRTKTATAGSFNKKFGFSERVAMTGLTDHEAGLGFSGEMYRISRLQVLLRVAEILETGFNESRKQHAPRRRKGSITIPSRLQDVPSEFRKNPLRLDWTDDADEFVTNGIQQVFDSKSNLLLWANLNSMTIALKVRIRSLTALAKAGTVETDAGPQRIALKDIARITLKTAKWLEVENTVWVNVLNVTGEYTRVELYAVLDEYVREADNHSWLGTLDFMFRQLTEDKLGEGEGGEDGGPAARFARRNGPLANYASHALTIQAMSQPTLSIPAATMADLTELYKGALDQQLGFVGEFLEEAERLEALRKTRPETFPAWRIFSSRKSPDVPVLTVSAVERYRSLMLEYARQTGYVVPAKVDAAWKTR